MRTTITTLLAVASVCATSVHGQVDNCVELLRLSRTTSRTVVDRSQFTRTVNNVCNEIRKARSDNRSLNLDLRILGLGEGSGSNATTDSLYTKYCSDQSAEDLGKFNYQQYLEGLEPGAYAAYQACTTAASNDVEFQMLTSPTRDVLELVVFHETNRPNGRADMSWSASDPVACQWESFRGNGEVEAPQRRILEDNERTRLKCRRDSFNADPIREPDYVNVIRDGGNATINIPWRKYGPDNIPVQTLDEIQRQVESLSAEQARAEERIAQLTDELASRRFGAFVSNDLHVNTAYPADTDGFVIVRSRSGTAQLQSGPSPRQLEDRTRVARAGGAVLPVAKGDYWRVRWAENSGSVQILWLPVGIN